MSNESRQEEITAGAIRQTLGGNRSATKSLIEWKYFKERAERRLVEWKKFKEQAEALNHANGDDDAAGIENANRQICWLQGYLEGLSKCPPTGHDA
jgi:hypothetical protein